MFKKTLLALVSMFFLAGTPQSRAEDNQVTAKKKITQILNRADKWAHHVESDYTNYVSEGTMSLRRVPNELINPHRNTGTILIEAAYNHDYNLIYLPIINGKIQTRALERLLHEVVHGLDDKLGKKGLLRQGNVSVPSDEDITDYLTKRIDTQEFKDLEAEDIKIEESKLINKLLGIGNSYLQIMQNAEGIYTVMNQTSSIILQGRKHVSKNELTEYAKSVKECIDLYESFGKVTKGYFNFLKKNKDVFENLANHTTDELTEKRKLLEQTLEGFYQFTDIASELEKRAQLTIALSKKVTLKELDETETELKANNQRWSAEEYTENLKLIEEARKTTLDFSDKHSNLIATTSILLGPTRVMYNAVRQVYDKNIKRLDERFHKSGEFLARTLDSLYSLYFGKTDGDCYELNREDLQFLRKFKYDNGELIFKKGIQKYEIALDLKDKGVKPDEIREKLLDSVGYAKTNEVTGKTRLLLWPMTGWKMKGDIPMLKVK